MSTDPNCTAELPSRTVVGGYTRTARVPPAVGYATRRFAITSWDLQAAANRTIRAARQRACTVAELDGTRWTRGGSSSRRRGRGGGGRSGGRGSGSRRRSASRRGRARREARPRLRLTTIVGPTASPTAVAWVPRVHGSLLRADAKCFSCAAPIGAVRPLGNVADLDGTWWAGDRSHRPSRGDQRGYGGAGEELKRPTAADGAIGQSPLASSSKEWVVVSWLTCAPFSPKGGTRGLASPVDQRSLVCRVTKAGATCENLPSTNSAE